MPETLHHFLNFSSLNEQCRSATPFKLVYSLGTNQDKHLKRLANMCVIAPEISAVIFVVEPDKQDYDRLFFLKVIIERLLLAGKPVGIWGAPQCVPRKILGGYSYMRFRRLSIADSRVEVTEGQTFMVEICNRCIDRDGCMGLGGRNSETYKPLTKTIPAKQLPDSNLEPVKFNHKLLENKHKAFVEYSHTTNSRVADRRVYYATNIDYSSEHSYKNRFIYQCDYLPPEEYRSEYTFLKNHVVNTRWASRLEALSSMEKTKQIAYSLAENSGQTRESFYMFIVEGYGSKLLNDLAISFELPNTPDMNFIGIGIGIDIIEQQVACYKLYFKSPLKFVANYFDIDILGLSHNSHYLVLRLDKESNLISFKIELLFSFKDFPILKPLLRDYSYLQEQLEPLELYNFAVEFEHNTISKINIYHRGQLAI